MAWGLPSYRIFVLKSAIVQPLMPLDISRVPPPPPPPPPTSAVSVMMHNPNILTQCRKLLLHICENISGLQQLPLIEYWWEHHSYQVPAKGLGKIKAINKKTIAGKVRLKQKPLKFPSGVCLDKSFSVTRPKSRQSGNSVKVWYYPESIE
jgi:hypothetical protein